MKKALAAVEVIIGAIIMVCVISMDFEMAVKFGIGFGAMTICGKYARDLLE